MITSNGLENYQQNQNITPGLYTPKSVVSAAKTPKESATANANFSNDTELLVNCNNRLKQHFSNQHIREQKISALETEVSKLAENIVSEKQNTKRCLKKVSEQFLIEKTEYKKSIVDLKTETERVESELKNSQISLEAQSKEIMSNEKRILGLTKRRECDLAILNRLNGLVQKFRNEKEKKSKEAEFLRGENETLRCERDRVVQEKYVSDKKSLNEVTAAYKKETNELKAKANEIEESLRIKFDEQLDTTLKARQKSFAKEKDNAIKELTIDYENKINSITQKIDTITAELTAAVENTAELKTKHKKAQTAAHAAQKTLAAQKNRIALLEQRISALGAKPAAPAADANVVRLLKEAYRRKEAELEALAEERDALSGQIKEYCAILDREEEWLTGAKPATPKTLTPGGTTSPAKAPQKAAAKPEVPAVLAEDELAEKPVPLKRRRSNRTRRSSGRPEGVPAAAEKTAKAEEKENEEAELAVKAAEKKAKPAGMQNEEAEPAEKKAKSAEKAEEKTAAEEEKTAEEETVECVFECYGSGERIEVRNKSREPVPVEGWELRKAGAAGAGVRFPKELAKNETFFVYPSSKALETDESAGHKKVWDEKAFLAESGDIVIVNGAGEEMYRFEISEKSEIDSTEN